MTTKLQILGGQVVSTDDPLPVTTTPSTNDPGYSYFRRPSNLDETKREVKATAGNVYAYTFINPNTSPVYVKIYDAAAADVTVGTTVPKLVVAVPAGDGTTPGEVILTPDGNPVAAFAAGITIAAVTGLADNSAGAITSDIHAEVTYK